MTMSEQRLHPASILFDIARYARIFAWPALIAFIGGPRGGPPGMGRWNYDTTPFETWLWVLVLPSLGLSIVRYLTFRVRYEPNELVIRSGLLFRNVRHIPYARVQNLDAVQNVFHRALGVADVRIETGSGSKAEARLSVLPASDLDAMRARVFAGRAPAARARPMADRSLPSEAQPLLPEQLSLPEAPSSGSEVSPEGSLGADRAGRPPQSAGMRVLLRLSFPDLLLLGFLENKGMVLMSAAYAALWEAGLMNGLWSRFFEGTIDARGLFRQVGAFILGRGPLPGGRLALALVGLAAFLVVVRLVSMAWAALRLHGFRLTRSGDDLRVTYGFFTRVAATIPLRRVQAVTVQRGWLARRLGRASIRVETAGGRAGAATRDREWVAPLIREHDVGALLAEVLPGAILPEAGWEPVHPRAFRRAVKPVLLLALIASTVLALTVGWRLVVVALPLLAWLMIATRQHVRHLAWLASESLVAFRSGWLSQAVTIVRVNRVQSVTLRESPFDRRAGMAGVRVDTAGAAERSHRVDIPYLEGALARGLQQRLAGAAARTDFQW